MVLPAHFDFSTIRGAERFIQSIGNTLPELSTDTLAVTHRDIGALGASIQALATWSRLTPARLRINTATRQSLDQYLATGFENDLALIAAAIAREIVHGPQQRDVYLNTMHAARLNMEQRHRRRYRGTGTSHILCVRNPYLARRSGSPLNFDVNDLFFRSREGGTIIDSLRGLDEPDSELPQIFTDGVAGLGLQAPILRSPGFGSIRKAVFELFENANVWGLAPLGGMELAQNVRGMYLRFHPIEPNPHFQQFTSELRILDYLNQFVARGTIDKLRGFLELTVYDCGPGLPAMINGSPLSDSVSPRREYELLLDCLRLRGSSRDSINRGKGLHVVFTRLDELGGFLLLRTGRFAVCRDFLARPFNAADAQAYQMQRFFNRDAPRVPRAVTGALFVIVVPLYNNPDEQTSLGI